MKSFVFFALITLSMPSLAANDKWAIETVQFDASTINKVENGTFIRFIANPQKVITWCKPGTVATIPDGNRLYVVCEKQEVRTQHPRQ